MSSVGLCVMPSSVFRDDHVKDTVGHHSSSVDNLENLTSRGGTPAIPPTIGAANSLRPRRDTCFYIEPVTFQVSNSLSSKYNAEKFLNILRNTMSGIHFSKSPRLDFRFRAPFSKRCFLFLRTRLKELSKDQAMIIPFIFMV